MLRYYIKMSREYWKNPENKHSTTFLRIDDDEQKGYDALEDVRLNDTKIIMRRERIEKKLLENGKYYDYAVKYIKRPGETKFSLAQLELYNTYAEGGRRTRRTRRIRRTHRRKSYRRKSRSHRKRR